MPLLYVASDGTGRTANHAAKAALTQFSDQKVTLEIHAHLRSEEQIRELVQEARKNKAFVIHTLVSDALREELIRFAREQHVETTDLMGPLLDRLSLYFKSSPSEQPGLYRKLNDAYFRRVEAMQFAFNNDDGKRLDQLGKAEIVLLGVSRTFKTPLSIYLAFKGWYVANIPIVMGMPVPEEVFKVNPDKIFCLITLPSSLAILRKVRMDKLKGMTGDYANPDYVRKEIRYANQIYDTQPHWKRVKVTSKPIEEIASEIIALLPKKIKQTRCNSQNGEGSV